MSDNNQDWRVAVPAAPGPNSSSQNAQAAMSQPRQPRNLQGLLRFAMEATKAEDAPGNSDLGPMDEERRRFLEEALRSLTVDTAEVLQNSIKVLTNLNKMSSIPADAALPEDVQTAFTNLLNFIDDLDIANDFYKVGGFAVFPICYSSENAEVRMYTSTVLAELCQNNPFCQARALECGLLNVLINLAQTEKGQSLAKCLYALSCVTREYKPACRELTAQGGCEVLVQLLRSSDDKIIRTKTAFLIRYLCHQFREAKEQFLQIDLVRVVSERLKAGRDETSEHLLSSIYSLLGGLDDTVLTALRDPTVNLKKILEDHLKHPDLEGDRFFEEKEYCQEILQLIFEDKPPVQEVDDLVADR